MFPRNKIGFLVVMSFIALTEVKASSKYYDGEIRPYEFGYRIEGNQHRHERKDANGIINGEFGFITGDGTYHSSVYATDENGNFKLLSLRSSFTIVKVTTTTAPPTTLASVAISRESKSLENRPISVKTCSNCKVIEKEKFDLAILTTPNPIRAEGKAVSLSFLTSTVAVETKDQKHENSTRKLDKLTKSNEFDNDNVVSKSQPNFIGRIAKISVDSPLNNPLGISTAGITYFEQIKRKHKETAENNNASISRMSSELTTSKISSSVKSNHMSAITQTKSETENSNTIDNRIPIEETHQRTSKALQPSTSSKLSSKEAINEFIGDVIYRFNYTAGYHGHNEEGDSFGNKVGGYFIVGRDNIKRGVIYVANGNGFIPVVKYEKVSSGEAPHENTEKNAGLRGYEFEWLHKGKSIR